MSLWFSLTARVPSLVLDENITHNLGEMAAAAGVYDCLWRAPENGLTQAGQIITPLQEGIALMEADPERFRAMSPTNAWGSYEGLLEFCKKCLAVAEAHPEAEIGVNR